MSNCNIEDKMVSSIWDLCKNVYNDLVMYISKEYNEDLKDKLTKEDIIKLYRLPILLARVPMRDSSLFTAEETDRLICYSEELVESKLYDYIFDLFPEDEEEYDEDEDEEDGEEYDENETMQLLSYSFDVELVFLEEYDEDYEDECDTQFSNIDYNKISLILGCLMNYTMEYYDLQGICFSLDHEDHNGVYVRFIRNLLNKNYINEVVEICKKYCNDYED